MGKPKLVGREAELAALRDAVDGARLGRGGAVVMDGEPGIGKSRLVQELCDHAEAAGVRFLVGRAHELERHRPFGAVLDAVGPVDQLTTTASRVRELLLADNNRLKGVTGSLRRPELQFAAVDAIATGLEDLAATGPVVVVLEDLHWADEATLTVAQRLMDLTRRAPLVFVATWRTHANRSMLGALIDLADQEGHRHLALGALDERAVLELAQDVAGAAAASSLVEQVAGAGGNPLFVVELVRSLADEGRISVAGGVAEVAASELPAAFQGSMTRRLRTLSTETSRALRLASVLGATFALADLAMVLARSASDLLSVVDEAMDAGLLEEAGDELAFRHDLVRLAVYEDMPRALRLALHRQVAGQLAAAARPAAVVAAHHALAATPGDAGAVWWLERAAVDALGTAPADAVALLDRALTLVDADDPAYARIAADRLLPMIWCGRLEDVADAASRLLRLPDLDPAVEQRVQARLATTLALRGRPREAAEHQLIVAESMDAGARARYESDTALIRALTGDIEGAWSASTRAQAEAVRLGDRLTLASAQCSRALLAMIRGDLDGARVIATEAVDLCLDVALPSELPRLYLGMTLNELDDRELAQSMLTAARASSERRGATFDLPLFHTALAVSHYHTGDWDRALAETEVAIAVGSELDEQLGAVWAWGVRSLLSFRRGDHEGARSAAASGNEAILQGSLFGLDWLAATEALLLEASGDVEAAHLRLYDTLRLYRDLGLVQVIGRLSPDAVRLALAVGDREAADALVGWNQELAARTVMPHPRAAAERIAGLVDDDFDRLVLALDLYRSSERPYDIASAAADASAAAARRGDEAAARSLFDEACSGFERLGAAHELARVQATLRGLGIRSRRSTSRVRPQRGWESLTPAETEVVRLLREGLSNPEIAARLYISRRTVTAHLSAAFRKIGVRTRLELVTVAESVSG